MATTWFLRKVASLIYSPSPLEPVPGWYAGMLEDTHQLSPARQRMQRLWLYLMREAPSLPVAIRWILGIKLYVYPGAELSRCIYVEGVYEPNELYVLSQLLRSGMVFMDVGANNGFHALPACRFVGPEGRVVALEPSSREFDKLRRNIAANRFTNIHPLRVGLLDRTGSMELLVAEDKYEGHNTFGSFLYPTTGLKTKEKVEVTTLDTLAEQLRLERLDVLKVDTKGTELAVLEGGTESIRRFKPAILTQLFDTSPTGKSAEGQRILDFLKDLSYSLYSFSSVSGLPMLICPQKGREGENVLAVPREREASLRQLALRSCHDPLVSIVTPCHNSARFISECIESVLAQDYPRVEHVIQDGQSRDGTADIIRKYAERYPDRIRWRSEPDHGQTDGLNRAVQRACGDILLVLNADDALFPRACSWGVRQLVANPDVAVVYGDEVFIDSAGKMLQEFKARPYDFEQLLCLELVPPAQAAFIRRSCFEQVGLYADASLDTCPDYEMWVRLGLKFPMKHVPGMVTKYRRHSGSEGQRIDMIERFIRAKKKVMDRVFDDESIAPVIRSLRERAYRGLVRWSGEVCVDAGHDPAELLEVHRQFFVDSLALGGEPELGVEVDGEEWPSVILFRRGPRARRSVELSVGVTLFRSNFGPADRWEVNRYGAGGGLERVSDPPEGGAASRYTAALSDDHLASPFVAFEEESGAEFFGSMWVRPEPGGRLPVLSIQQESFVQLVRARPVRERNDGWVLLAGWVEVRAVRMIRLLLQAPPGRPLLLRKACLVGFRRRCPESDATGFRA